MTIIKKYLLPVLPFAFAVVVAIILLIVFTRLYRNARTWDAVVPDRVPDTVVIYAAEGQGWFSQYFGEPALTEKIARVLAEQSGSALYNLHNDFITDFINDYRIFYLIGGDTDGHLQVYLKETDFLDGLVVPFNLTDEEKSHIIGARFLENISGTVQPGVSLDSNDKSSEASKEELQSAIAGWLTPVQNEITILQTAGDEGLRTMQAFLSAYPERIRGPVILRPVPGQEDVYDWSFMMDDEIYYYQNQKFLNADDIKTNAQYNSVLIYNYNTDFADIPFDDNTWAQEAQKIFFRRDIFASSSSWRSRYGRGANRSPFYQRLLKTETRDESFASSVLIEFLAWTVRVHNIIAEPLARIEKRILELQEEQSRTEDTADDEIALWRNQLDSITAWNWRTVAGSSNLSYHSFGTAVDLLMKAQPGKYTYWQWARREGVSPGSISNDDKLNPPDSVIRIFEEAGFIWGGKWRSWFDTMHFEYRPESIVLSFR
ncbi:MAG: M15 family metallopeptidase [Spirochaetaceae bacterium]|jgi:hypothetical protein|nr:M15 family metallopeptidase [Spirochaetaceae bacterium]